MRTLTVGLVAVSCLTAGCLDAQTMSDQELHDRIVAGFARNTSRSVPQGDTFVTWNPRPILYSTVHRRADRVESSLIRADGMVGTAEATWRQGRPSVVRILWTQGSRELMRFDARTDSGRIVLSGGRDTTLTAPALPWAIADYGMGDQVVPLVDAIGEGSGPRTIAVYRPYPNHWDSLSVTVERRQDGRRVTLVGDDGERWTWVISAKGALVQITSSKQPDVERRPLETTAPTADYLRLREASP